MSRQQNLVLLLVPSKWLGGVNHYEKTKKLFQPRLGVSVSCSGYAGFEAEFCNPAEAQEKGGVEGKISYFRRNRFVPIPHDFGILKWPTSAV